MKLYDWKCRGCGAVAEHVTKGDRKERTGLCCEGAISDRLFPAPRAINWLGDQTTKAVQTGRPDDRSHVPPWVTDTSKLGRREQGYHEWRREQRTKRMDEITREVEREVGDPRTTIYGGAASAVK